MPPRGSMGTEAPWGVGVPVWARAPGEASGSSDGAPARPTPEPALPTATTADEQGPSVAEVWQCSRDQFLLKTALEKPRP